MSPSNSITPWTPRNPLDLTLGQQTEREQAVRSGKQAPTKPGLPGGSCTPTALWERPSRAIPGFRASSPQPASPRAVSHPAPGIRRLGERVSAPRWFTSCRLWPWPCPVPYPRGWIWAGCGQAPRAPLPPTRGGTRRRFFKHLVVEYL